MFEKASRLKLKFNTAQGTLGVEDLWDLPLTSNKGKANLDDIAKSLSKQLKETDTESFVVKTKRVDETAQLGFDIVLHIIGVKQKENDQLELLRLNREKKQKLLSLIAKKQDESLEGASLDDLKKMVDEME